MFVASHISNAMISSPELAIKYNLATNSWASFDGLMLDMREHLEERNYVFYTVGLGSWEYCYETVKSCKNHVISHRNQ